MKLTETSSRYARKISGTTALQEALKEKQQHIEQLLAERDLERAEVAKATSHVGEIEQELALVRDGHDRVRAVLLFLRERGIKTIDFYFQNCVSFLKRSGSKRWCSNATAVRTCETAFVALAR